MKHKLRKLIPFIFLAVISMAVILPSAFFVAPQAVQAEAAAPAAPAATTPPATSPAKETPKANSAELGIVSNAMVQAIGWIVETLINILGLLTISLIHILILVAGYNGYMTAPAITTGWVIVRDIANMFFVALILIVSIGSIVNPNKFGGVKQVFRILLYALLVNFSRTIAGIFIDISQLVMLTFVNGFAQAAGGNFVEALGVTKINDVSSGSVAITFSSAIGAYILALFIIIIITVIIAVMVVALVVRMVTLWMLVILSPIAFAMGASDLTKEHYSEWWKKFSAELTTGPIVAFFLWLSLVTFQSYPGTTLVGEGGLSETSAKGTESTQVNIPGSKIGSQDNMIRFIVAACMLIMGLGFAKQFSGLGGAMASGAISKGKGYAKVAQGWAGKKAWGATKTVGGVGLAVSGLPRASHLAGDYYTGAKSKVGGLIGRQRWMGTYGRAIGGAMLTSAAKRDEERLKVARETTQAYTPQMRTNLLNAATATDAERKAVAMDIVKDRPYKNANAVSTEADPQKRAEEEQHAEVYRQAVATLGKITPGRDKDVDDVLKDISEARPELKNELSGGKRSFVAAETAAEMDRDKLKKINWDAIPEAARDAIFSGLKPETFRDYYEKAPGKVKEYMDHATLRPGIEGAELQAVLTAGTVNLKTAKLDMPQTAGQPVEKNIEIVREMMNRTAPTPADEEIIHRQFGELRDNKEARDMREAMVGSIRSRLNFATGDGIDHANDRIEDNILRDIEGVVSIGREAGEFYKFTENGDFDLSDIRGIQSFRRSLTNSPQRLEFIMNLKGAALKGQAGMTVERNVDDATLSRVVGLAKEPEDLKNVKALVQRIYEIGNASRKASLVANPELRHLIDTARGAPPPTP